MKKMYLALILSFLFHLSQLGLVEYFPSRMPSQNDSNKPIDIEMISSPDQEPKEKQIIKTIKDKTQMDMNTPAQFNAEETNRTQTQTKAQEFGKFRNSEKNNLQKLKQNQTPQIRNQTQNQTQKKNEGGLESKPQANTAQFTQQLNMPSRSEYQLPNDIQYGSATNLNTDAYMYASFYNRVTDLFYIRWSEKLESIWSRLSDETKRSLAGRTWSTDVEIWLDSSGKYQQGFIMKKSGFSPFDSAGIFAFKDAGFFPNPPKAKVDADGHIRLRYRINIQIR